MLFPQLIIPLLIAAATPTADTSPPAKLEFPLAGYRINALEELSKEEAAHPWMGRGFSMVPHGSFPRVGLPRVGAQVVASSDGKRTMAEFAKNEKSGHVHFGDTILSDQLLSATEWQVEYRSGAGRPGGQVHGYERVLLANGQFYHASAIESESSWANTGPALKAWVNSLETIAGPGASPPSASPGKLVFPQHGLRINSPDAAPTSDKDIGTLTLAAGLTVTNQAYSKTLKDYQAATKPNQQNAQDKIKVSAESFPAENTWIIEYTEEYPPDKVNHHILQAHTYKKVILAHGQLYQAEATLLDDRYDPAYFAKLKACVDSLEAIPTSASTAAPPPLAPVPAK